MSVQLKLSGPDVFGVEQQAREMLMACYGDAAIERTAEEAQGERRDGQWIAIA